MLESGSNVIACRDMVIQEGSKISKEDYLLSSEPASEKNGTKFSTSIEVLEDLSAESTNDLGCLLLNEKNLQQGKGKNLVL